MRSETEINSEDSRLRYFYYIVIIAAVLFNFIATKGLLAPGIPNGGDAAAHYNLLVNTGDVFKTFLTTGELILWNPDYYTGFPMFYFYAPFPYFILAFVHIITGVSLLTLQKATTVLLYASTPFIFFTAMRIMKFSRVTAMFAGVLSTLPSSFTLFGYEYYAYFASGLFSQLIGMTFFPLALATTWRYLNEERSNPMFSKWFFASIFFTALTFWSHILAGLILTVTTLLLHVSWNTKDEAKAAIKKYILLYSILFLLTAGIFVPYLIDQESYPGLPWSNPLKSQGLGLQRTITHFFKGNLLDYSDHSERLPIITVLTMGGLLILLFTKKKYPLKRFLGASFLLAVILIMGKRTFVILEYIPLINAIEQFRFIALFHISGIIISAITLSWILVTLQEKIATIAKNKSKGSINNLQISLFIFIGMLMLLSPIITERYQAATLNSVTYLKSNDEQTQNKQLTSVEEEFIQITSAIKNTSTQGRVYDEVNTDFISTLQYHQSIPIYAKRPILISYSIGHHDAFTSFFLTELPRTKEIAELFNIDYIIFKENSKHTFQEVDSTGKSGYFQLIPQPKIIINATPKQAREILFHWLRTDLLNLNEYIIVAPLDEHKLPVPENTYIILILTPEQEKKKEASQEEKYLSVEESEDFAAAIPRINEQNTPVVNVKYQEREARVTTQQFFNSFLNDSPKTKTGCDVIQEESSSRGKYIAKINTTKSCVLMLKVTYHKEWNVQIDKSSPEQPLYISPSFMGVVIPPGEHIVTFYYKVSTVRKVLFVISIVTVMVLLVLLIFHSKHTNFKKQ